MDELLELLLEIVLEGTAHVMEDDSKRHGKVIKAFSAIVLCLYALMVLAVAIMLVLLAIKIGEEHIFASVLMLLIDFMIWVYFYTYIKRYGKIIKQHNKKREEDEFL